MESGKILLHVCCAPCATSCVERLLENRRHVVLFYSNSNIDTHEEYDKRLQYIRQLALTFKVPLLIDPYDHDEWLQRIAGLEDEPEKGPRCVKCFDYSLKQTAAKALETGIEAFTTTLSVSPHKKSQVIFNVGQRYHGFENWNFKKLDGFKRSLELSKQLDLYRQAYCGCEFSKRTS
ncbi:MAG: epoxyqueuosine reductase QueH [Lentisphaerae bacterium]|nr:epoxyqueuosine reductase QueH [Lentisphaerota bacterium]MCP4100058.1 epoxyqueuosine reductase QueH [Lentisphaerota bacterium]